MKLKRGFTILLVLFFFVTLTLSLTFIAENFHHDCTGNDCVICRILETAEEISGGDSTSTAGAAGYAIKPLFTDSVTAPAKTCGAAVCTPVSLNDLLTI